MRSVLAIDPGKAGGIVGIQTDDLNGHAYSIHKMPDTVGDLVDILRTMRAEGWHTAYVERVASSPQMGVVSAFTFGRGVGNIEAACQALGLRLEWVAPSVWQKAMGCLTKGDKNISKRRAQELFPAVKVTHANADALLIAEYGRRLEATRTA
ncbi:MAG TPA: hypothetical protein VEC57_00160 [Candidatus Limnocylindrales bacterium]|nr:hypothetical protein [Candidatus Limnocylindrales bacterium]